VNTIGAIGLCGCIVYEDLHILVFAGVLAVVGLIFGIFAHRNDIPPRWFWSKSRNDIFSFSVTAVLGYAMSFAMWPCAIYIVKVIIEMM
jgi:cytochrome c biogenesis protein CcdA